MFCIRIEDIRGNILEEENIREREYAHNWKKRMERLLEQDSPTMFVRIEESEEKNRTPEQVLQSIRNAQVTC